MRFEIGKCYKHIAGEEIQIIGALKTTLWGYALIAECVDGPVTLKCVGSDENSAVNWIEIPQEVFQRNFQ